MLGGPQIYQEQLFKRDEFYRNSWWRLGSHILLWLTLYLFLLAQYDWISHDTKLGWSTQFLTIGNLFVMMIIFYSVANFALPRLYQKRWLYLLISVVFVYVINSFGNYIVFVEVDKWTKTSQGVHRVAKIYQDAGMVGGLTNRIVFILNWSFMLNTIIPISVKFMKDILVSRNYNTQLERDNLALELNFLRSQVNPHFFFNAINNIYALIVDKDEQATNILIKLSSLMRYVLYEAGTRYVTLEQEINFLKDYVGLEKVRHGNNVSILLHIEGNAGKLAIPPLVLITFVENAFKHGINATINESWVTIDLIIKNNSLHFLIRNSKPPHKLNMGKSLLPKVGGIGITNTQRRLELLYPDAHQLKIQEMQSIFTVDLTIILDGTRTNVPNRR